MKTRSSVGRISRAISGVRTELSGPAGRLNLYVAGKGPPLILLHSINAAASAAEVRPLQEYYRSTHKVFALDLPGFGGSERSDRVYTPRLMTDAVLVAVDYIRTHFGSQPVDALAVSLSCEYLARAATEMPTAFRSLALVSPTGFSGRSTRRGPPGSTLFIPWLYRLLRGPGWGETLYRGLTRPGVIRYFLQRTWGSKQIDRRLWACDVEMARAPGAWYAPLYFLSAGLFSADIHTVYERLTMPVWMSHGERGDFTDFRNVRLVEGRPNWRFRRFATGALPYFELLESFCAEYDAFLMAR
jgi:pimeloyl-ACP methyl ester carboxylesterase